MATFAAHGGHNSEPAPVSGREYLIKLRKYLGANLSRLAPAPPPRGKPRDASWLQQSYTVFTLGLDPNSAPLSRNVKIPLTLGFGTPSVPPNKLAKPVLLRLPPDKLLYLLLRWQSLPQQLNHVGHTDVPVPEGVAVSARGARAAQRGSRVDGDVDSVRSWVGSIRSVSMRPNTEGGGGFGWWSKPKTVEEDKLLLELYSIFNALPALLIHPPFSTDPQVSELLDAGGYTSLGGVDVRVPLDVMRNLQILELDAFDPRGLLVPVVPMLHSLTVRDVEDADDWLPELLVDGPLDVDHPKVRFPNLQYLSLHHTSLLSFPSVPLTSLTHLDLSHNELNAIPEALSQMHSLVSLNLSSNVITSVRNASTTLGNIHSINLSHNRIDCLVGLDRVLGLRRVDVRDNLLLEPGEVGRLAVVPQVEAIWAAENPLSEVEDWRVEIAATFAGEGQDVLLDDTPLSWTEQRRVEALLSARGKAKTQRQPMHHKAAPPPKPEGLAPPSPARAGPAHGPIPVTRAISPKPSPAKVAPKKRPKRRVVNLDDGPVSPTFLSPNTIPSPEPTSSPSPLTVASPVLGAPPSPKPASVKAPSLKAPSLKAPSVKAPSVKASSPIAASPARVASPHAVASPEKPASPEPKAAAPQPIKVLSPKPVKASSAALIKEEPVAKAALSDPAAPTDANANANANADEPASEPAPNFPTSEAAPEPKASKPLKKKKKNKRKANGAK